MVATLVVVGGMALAHDHVHRNGSSSLPFHGPYVVWKSTAPVRVGDFVEACPPVDSAREAFLRHYVPPGPCPGGVAPFLKMVAAAGSDIVTVTPFAVYVNGNQLPHSGQIMRDRNGLSIITRPFGTYYLKPGQIWLYGTNPRSLDSRKFGPVSTETVRYRAWVPAFDEPIPNLPALVHPRANLTTAFP